MRRIVLSVAVFLAMTGAGAANPIADFFFHYRPPEPPVGGSCAAIAAEVGPEAVWYGAFAGKRYDDFTDQYRSFSARGCFRSEAACRTWQQVGITYLQGGPIIFARCRLGGPA